MKNMTTATAVTSNGQPAPAGLSTGAEQRPAAGDAARAARRRFSNPLLFNNIFWDNRAGHAPGRDRDRHRRRRRRDPDRRLGPRRRRWLRARWRRRTRSSSRTPATTRTRRAPTNVGGQPGRRRPYDVVARVRPVADEPELPRRDPRRPGPAAEAARRLPPDRAPDRRSAFNLGAASKAVPSYQQPPSTPRLRRPPTSTAIRGRLSAASTSAPTRSRRHWPTCRSPRPTASRPSSRAGR